jgi:nucleotidyltransferase substrate binding protein (TIGR01987 family)
VSARLLCHPLRQSLACYHSIVSQVPIALTPLRKALAQLSEALIFWGERPDGDPLKPHLRSAVIQSFEYTYELSVRAARRVLIERVESADLVTDLSFNDLLRRALDAGFPMVFDDWRHWRDMRNGTSHAYDEERAQAVALEATAFALDANRLLQHLELTIGGSN